MWVSVFLAVLTLIVYAPVWHYQFVAWDDPSYVSENPMVSAGLTAEGMRWAFGSAHLANWHPLTWLSHMLDVQLFGLHPGAHHGVNLLIHIVNALLLFALLHGLLYGTPGALGGSGFVAALFAVHPLHVESVAWVAERKDVLSTLFFLLALHAYVRYVRRPARGRFAALLLLFCLGLMAKAMLVTLPFVLLLLDVWPLGRIPINADPPGRSKVGLAPNQRSVLIQLLREKVPLLLLAGAFSILTLLVQRGGGSVVALDAFPFSLRVQNAIVSYLAYIGKTLWPVNLAAFYPYPGSFPFWLVGGSALVLIVISVAVIRLIRKQPYLAVGWFWYLGTLVPVIGLVQVGGQPMADRYTYIPLIGLFVMAAWGIPALLRRWTRGHLVLYPVAGVMILACAIVARGQVSHWQNSTALWEHALAVTEGNFTAHTNLGHALLREGRVAEAIEHYTEALRIRPNFADAHQGLGVALASQGNLPEAIAHYEEALRIRPDLAETHNYLGAALASQGKFDEAVFQYSEALRLQPDFADAHNNLGAALASQGKYDQAFREFLEALRLKPTADVHYNVGTMYEQKGDFEQAIRHYRTALQLDPAHQSARAALEELSGASRPAGSPTP